MDDRSFVLAVATLGVAAGSVLLDAALVNFDVPAGFWAVLSAVLGFLGARAAINGKGDK